MLKFLKSHQESVAGAPVRQNHSTINSDHVRRVVFVKLRKTGGTTLSASVLFPYCVRHGLKYMVPSVNWWAVHPKFIKEEQNFHMMFRHFPDFPQPWAQKWLQKKIGNHIRITILRDPVSRAFSWYNHIKQHNEETLTFNRYFDIYHEKNHQSNWLGFDGRDKNFLSNNFEAVGLTERFDESMLLFRQVLNLDLEDMLYVSQRVDSTHLLKLDRQMQDKIKELDWLDMELYAQAKLLFEKSIKNIPEVQIELLIYQQALHDFGHSLWGKRKPFFIGYSMDGPWAKFTGQNGKVVPLHELGS